MHLDRLPFLAQGGDRLEEALQENQERRERAHEISNASNACRVPAQSSAATASAESMAVIGV